MVHLTEKVMNFLMLMKENGGKITRKEQDMYDAIRYYIMMSYLKKNELVICDGINDYNEKIWKLTPKGEKVVDILSELRRELNVKVKGNSSGQ